jgi:hypothetical protein
VAAFYKDVYYAFFMGTRPQTLTALADSPVGLATFMIDHDARSLELISRTFNGVPEGLSRDDVLDNITLFWLSWSTHLYKSGPLPDFNRRPCLCCRSRPLYEEQRDRVHFASMVCRRSRNRSAGARTAAQPSDLASGFGAFLPEDGWRSTRLTHVRHSEVLPVLPFNIDVGQTCGPLTNDCAQKSDRHDRMAGGPQSAERSLWQVSYWAKRINRLIG